MDIERVFLDLGMHNCEGLKHFKKELNIDSSWKVHTFEPNSNLDNTCWDTLGLDVTLHRKGVWTETGTFEFLMFGENGLSQGAYITPVGDKKYIDYHSKMLVECINFIEFLKQFENVEVYIKMDIEWAEYAIITKMLDEGWNNNIKKMWVEWHGQHSDKYIQEASELKTRIKNETNTQMFDWI